MLIKTHADDHHKHKRTINNPPVNFVPTKMLYKIEILSIHNVLTKRRKKKWEKYTSIIEDANYRTELRHSKKY